MYHKIQDPRGKRNREKGNKNGTLRYSIHEGSNYPSLSEDTFNLSSTLTPLSHSYWTESTVCLVASGSSLLDVVLPALSVCNLQMSLECFAAMYEATRLRIRTEDRPYLLVGLGPPQDPQMRLSRWPERGRSVPPCLDYCPHNLTPHQFNSDEDQLDESGAVLFCYSSIIQIIQCSYMDCVHFNKCFHSTCGSVLHH